MTERLYLSDSYRAACPARILERVLMSGNRLGLVLDQTVFHPETSAFPADRGWLGKTPVVGVVRRDGDGEILHVVSEEIWADQTEARIDLARRLDVLQQHTAGHLLAHALDRLGCGPVTALAVGEAHAFLELDLPGLTSTQLEQAERMANEMALANRAVRGALVDAGQAAKLNLDVPAGMSWPMRVISIEGDGTVPCAAPHLARTGEAGLIKVTSNRAHGNWLQIYFKAGLRALAEFRQLQGALDQVGKSLGMNPAEAGPAAVRLASDLAAARAELAALRSRTVTLEAEAIAATAETKVIERVYADRDVAELRQLASLLVARPGWVVLLGASGSRAQLIFARSPDIQHDMTVFIRAAAQVLNTQGGGQPARAETAPTQADEARVRVAIAKAAKLLRARR